MSRPLERPDAEAPIEEVLHDEKAERQQSVVLALIGLFLVAIGIVLWLVYREESKDATEHRPEATAPRSTDGGTGVAPKVVFREAAADLGLVFRHENGATGQRLLPETMGSGAAFFDFDDDGDQDLFLVNSAPWDEAARKDGPTQAFFVNERGRFRDATTEVGLDLCFYGMGAAVGDYDGDGRVDLYVTAVGENRLFRNVDGKRFEDVTDKVGVGGGDHWSTGAAFLDFDRDGDLDLFVLNYVKWSPEIDLRQTFSLGSLDRAYGPPTGFEGELPRFFVNDGQGGFDERSKEVGVQVLNPATGYPMAKSLALRVLDLDEDGYLDVVVANDTVQNFLFRNRQDGTFEEIGAVIGIAFSDGKARGAMGIDSSHFMNDARLAVSIGNFANEMTAFYVNEEPGFPTFVDDATTVGIGAPTRESLTFGLCFFDFDLDGFEDLIATNGHVEPEIERVQASQRHAQALDLFWNAAGQGVARFQRMTPESAGDDLFLPIVGRGLALADVDGDGDVDVLATENGGRPRLFINEQTGGRSIRIDLRLASGAPALGAELSLVTSAGKQRRLVGGGGSYLVASESIVTFGLGEDPMARDLRIRWPDGRVETLDVLAPGRHQIRAAR
ncbi:MAG: CRTAC1 family protein [Planctomycetes bacterium]|nr:CRTAC1 family protein [Planctomycetota bacterium]